MEERLPPESITPRNHDTYFRPSEAEGLSDERREQLKRMFMWDIGIWKGGDRLEDTSEVRRRDNLYLLDALSSRLELNHSQKERARLLFGELDLRKLGRPATLIAFCVCVVIANEDSVGKRYWPGSKRNGSLFERVAEELGFNDEAYLSVMLKLENRRERMELEV